MSSSLLERPRFGQAIDSFDWEDSEQLGDFVESGPPPKSEWVCAEFRDSGLFRPSRIDQPMDVCPRNESRLLPPISEQVAGIIKWLSLTVTQAARILGVSRPTIYEWRNPEVTPNPTGANRRRLSNIFYIAKTWEAYGKGPIGTKIMIPFIEDHRSLLDELVCDELDVSKIKDRMRVLAEEPDRDVLVGQRESRWRETLREAGFEEPSEEEREANLEDNLRALYYEY